MNSFQKLQSSDRILNMVQDNIIKVLNPIASNELLNGHILIKIALKTGITNYVPHGLGRPLLGWYLTRIRANSMIYDAQDSNANPSSTLALIVSSNVTVDLAVF